MEPTAPARLLGHGESGGRGGSGRPGPDLVGASKTGREEHPEASTRQIDILTSTGDLGPEQVIHRMGWRWWRKNNVRYARMHCGLDSHDGRQPPMTTRPVARGVTLSSQKPEPSPSRYCGLMVTSEAIANRLRSMFLVRYWQLRGVRMGSGVRFDGSPIITLCESSSVELGDRTRLISSSRRATLGVNHPVIFRTVGPGAKIILGDDVGITGGTICAALRLEIGNGTMLGANVLITDTDFHPIESSERRYAQVPDPKPEHTVTIGSNVFIGTGSIILKGTTIGDNSVIGAGSVVSGRIPANVVVAGAPAKLIRTFSVSPSLT